MLTPATYALRHVVLDASGVATHNSVLATWHGDTAGQILGHEDDGSNNQHPRCGGVSCYYGLAWKGDVAMLAFSHGGAEDLAALRCVADCTPASARTLDAATLEAAYVPPPPPPPQPGLDEPVEYEFTGHVNVPGCYVEPGPIVEQAVRDRATFEFEVPFHTRFVNGSLDWETAGPTVGTTDLDLMLYDSEGDAFDAGTDDKPETFTFELHAGDQGSWTAVVFNCENPPTDFTLSLLFT